MPKKFIIKDEDGQQFEVTEETVDADPVETETEVKDDGELTPDEIAALKTLAARSADLIKLLDIEAKEHEAVADEDEDTDVVDADVCEGCGKPKDECICDEDEETIVETKTGDSKKSVGSIERSRSKANDSLEDRETAIADAWAARFNKAYKKGE